MKVIKKKNSGFSLLELIAAVVIMGLLVGGAALAVNRQVQKARMRAAQTEISTFEQAIGMFELDCGSSPSSLQDLIIAPPSGCKGYPDGGFLKKQEIADDPWGSSYNFAKPGLHNTSGYDLWSNGPDKEEGTSDDITNWASETSDDDL